MAKAVVDKFETVEIEKQDRDAVIGAPFAPLERNRDSFGKERAIGKTGQGIMQRIEIEFRGQALAFDHAAKLNADLFHQIEKFGILRQILAREKFHYGDDIVLHADRKGKGGMQAAAPRDMAAKKGIGIAKIDQP